MKNRNHQRGKIITEQAKDVVMLAMNHLQTRIDRGHVLGRALPDGDALDAASELRHIAAGLVITPPPTRVTYNVPKIGFRRRRQDIGGGQGWLSRPSSSLIMTAMLLVDKLPDKPSAMR